MGNQKETRYFVICPHCRKEIEFKFSNIVFKEKGVDGKYICQECGAVITNEEKIEITKEGRWIPGTTGKRKINPLYNISWSWTYIAEAFMKSRNDVKEMKSFVTRFLGEPWEN